jgi:hypothetical protein
MTKNVRVENADTSQYVVVVEVWDASAPQKCVETRILTNPADLGTFSIWKGRYLVIKEE